MSKTKEKIENTVTDTGRTLEQLMHGRIVRMHMGEEDMLRWGKKSRLDISGNFSGFNKEQITYIFNHKDDATNNKLVPGLSACTTLEAAEKLVEETNRPRANAELDMLRTFPKYSGMNNEQLIQAMLDETPSEEKALREFINREREGFVNAVKAIKKKHPELEIPLSIRYLDYVDDDTREMVKVCRVSGGCDFCYPYKNKKK